MGKVHFFLFLKINIQDLSNLLLSAKYCNVLKVVSKLLEALTDAWLKIIPPEAELLVCSHLD